jgi:hypothetical protein
MAVISVSRPVIVAWHVDYKGKGNKHHAIENFEIQLHTVSNCQI